MPYLKKEGKDASGQRAVYNGSNIWTNCLKYSFKNQVGMQVVDFESVKHVKAPTLKSICNSLTAEERLFLSLIGSVGFCS